MNSLFPYRPNHIASSAIVMLLSACGGGGGPAPSVSQAAAVASPAPTPAGASSRPSSSIDSPTGAPSGVTASDATFPQAAADAANYPWDEATPAYTLVPAPASSGTSGEAPYPDLRMLPMQVMPFEPIVFGDVSGVAVTPAG